MRAVVRSLRSRFDMRGARSDLVVNDAECRRETRRHPRTAPSRPLCLLAQKSEKDSTGTMPTFRPAQIERMSGIATGEAENARPRQGGRNYFASAARSACFFCRLIFAQRLRCATAMASRASALSERFTCLFADGCLADLGAAPSAVARDLTWVSNAIAASICFTNRPVALGTTNSLLIVLRSPRRTVTLFRILILRIPAFGRTLVVEQGSLSGHGEDLEYVP